MVGMGCPSAIQYNSNLVPTLTACGESEGSIVTLGTSERINNMIHFINSLLCDY